MAGPRVGDGSTTDRRGAPARVFRTELNPVDLLARAASMYAAKTAVVHGARRYSYAELGERAWRLANALRAAGLQKGDRVATLLPNSPGDAGGALRRPCGRRASSSPSTRGSRATRSGTSCDTPGPRMLLLDAELADARRRRSTSPALT